MRDHEKHTPEPDLPPLNETEAPTHSDGFGLLKISGLDAKKFLQGQVTCNLEEISATQSRLGAHCNPQGRVLFLFRLFYFVDAYYLVLPRAMTVAALKSLKKYAVFFKLELVDTSDTASGPLRELAAQEWQYFDPGKGRAQIYPETQGLFLPHDLMLHELEGLSWNKGCYTGQEIIARMHYRGKLKNQLYRATVRTAAPLRRGAEIYHVEQAAVPAKAGCSPVVWASKAQEDGVRRAIAQTTGEQPALAGTAVEQETFSACGHLVDFVEVGYNHYQVLVLTNEANAAQTLKLDPQQNETWEWSK